MLPHKQGGQVIRQQGTLADIPPLEPLADALLRHINFNFAAVPAAMVAYKNGYKKCAGKGCEIVAHKDTMTNFGKPGKALYLFCPACTLLRKRAANFKRKEKKP